MSYNFGDDQEAAGVGLLLGLMWAPIAGLAGALESRALWVVAFALLALSLVVLIGGGGE